MPISDDRIIAVLKNAWDHMPGNTIADAFMTTTEIAHALGLSPSNTLKLLKSLSSRNDLVKGVHHPGAWLWRYNE